MHTIEIPEAGKTLYLPDSLAECDSAQYIEMCELIYRFQTMQIPYETLREQAVYKLLGLHASKKQLLLMDEQAKWGNIYQVSRLLNTFFEDKDGQKVIRLEYINNPVPKFRPLYKWYYGPADAFTNVTFGEYLDCLRLFLDFAVTGNENLLYLLAAILYRPARRFRWLKSNTGDVRVAYNPHDLDKRAGTFKYAPKGFIYGVYLLFASFQKYITTAIVPWGGRYLDFSILFEGDISGQLEAVPGIGMESLVFALAESGEFGNEEGVRHVSFWKIMLRLYDLKKKGLDYKLNDKNANSK